MVCVSLSTYGTGGDNIPIRLEAVLPLLITLSSQLESEFESGRETSECATLCRKVFMRATPNLKVSEFMLETDKSPLLLLRLPPIIFVSSARSSSSSPVANENVLLAEKPGVFSYFGILTAVPKLAVATLYIPDSESVMSNRSRTTFSIFSSVR